MIAVDRRILNRRLEFATADEVLTFLEREDTLWQWTNAATIPNQATVAIQNYRGNWTEGLKNAADNWKVNPSDDALQSLTSQLAQRFQDRNAWCSEDPETWQVQELAKDDPSAAAVAMAVLTGRDHLIDGGQDEIRHGVRRGRARGYAILAGIDPESNDAMLSFAAEIKLRAMRTMQRLK